MSLCVIGENTKFHSKYLLKMHNSASSLDMLYTAESEQFYSVFSPTTVSLPWQSLAPLFAEDTQNDPKTHSYEDNAKFRSVFTATVLSYAGGFR
jgi:hypothetical protein